ncbi:MAG: class I SAM-dependent methyltransferase [Thermosynechococcaceae cyanobacterium]
MATLPFAELGCSMLCLEPNPDFCHLAQQNCKSYPNVEIQNCAFEEWILEPGRYDAVLAASSFHWIPPEVGYPKAAAALRPSGHLILLWNKELQPQYDLYQRLSVVYDRYAPDLKRDYEDSETQLAILNELGQMAIESGSFKDRVSGHRVSEVAYTVEQYLMLLNTYSSHLQLEPQQKQTLFAGLQQVLEHNGPSIPLSYVSAFHIARSTWLD